MDVEATKLLNDGKLKKTHVENLISLFDAPCATGSTTKGPGITVPVPVSEKLKGNKLDGATVAEEIKYDKAMNSPDAALVVPTKELQNMKIPPPRPLTPHSSKGSHSGHPRTLKSVIAMPFHTFLHENKESIHHFVNSACSLGARIVKVGRELANTIFSEEEEKDSFKEDKVQINGYTVRASGTALQLDSIHCNLDNGHKLQVKLKLLKLLVDNSQPKLKLDDNKWTLLFGDSKGLIEITVPLGVNIAQVQYDAPTPQHGIIIIHVP